MDVMRPEVYAIGKRFYRRNLIKESHRGHRISDGERPYREEEEEEFRVTYDEGECQENVAGLTERADGSWQLQMVLPSQIFPMIIGRRGETKKRIEVETRTTIRVPRQGVEGPLSIEGRERSGVMSARTRIEVIGQMAREKMAFTHFVSIPVTSGEVINGFEEFKSQVLDFCGGDRGIDPSLFQNHLKLHLTLGVLVLLSDAEVEKAGTVLEECRGELLKMMESPLDINCAGLEYMNDDPSEVDVLYMQVRSRDGSECLQRMADLLVDRFVHENLMARQYDRVKLHVTVMNTLFRKDPSGASTATYGESRRRPPRESFDATNLLKRFSDFEFAMGVPIKTVQLSQRFSTSEDGYYASSATVAL